MVAQLIGSLLHISLLNLEITQIPSVLRLGGAKSSLGETWVPDASPSQEGNAGDWVGLSNCSLCSLVIFDDVTSC